MPAAAKLSVVFCLVAICVPAAAQTDEQFDALVRDILAHAKSEPDRAVKLYEAAKIARENARIHIFLLGKVVEYGLRTPSYAGSRDVVRQSLDLLDKKAPAQRDLWARKRIELARGRYRVAVDSEQKKAAGERLVSLLLAAGGRCERAGNWSEAAATYVQVAAIATVLKMPAKPAILRLLVRATHFKGARQKVLGFVRTLESNSDNVRARIGLLTVLLVNLDKPAEAIDYLADDVGPVWNTYVPLAAEPVRELKAPACKELGDWYHKELRKSASSLVAKEIVLTRAKAYYARFLKLQPADETEAVLVGAELRAIENELRRFAPAAAKPPAAEPPAAKASWPDGAAQFGGHHYKVYKARKDWHAARKACKKWGGHLAYIETAEEMAFIRKLVGGSRIWVGATDAQAEGRWRWLNGQRVRTWRGFWHRKEPTGQAGENYASVRSDGLMDTTVNRPDVVGYLCEWDD